MSKSNEEKLYEALRELIEICVKEKLGLEFKQPTDDPQECYGSFTAAERSIEIFKERTEPLTIFHIYAFAHELRPYEQWSKLDGYDTWLYDIGVTRNTNQEELARLEMDADTWALSFLRKHKIRVTKKLREFVADRVEHFTDTVG